MNNAANYQLGIKMSKETMKFNILQSEQGMRTNHKLVLKSSINEFEVISNLS